ncbi:hypothetical protein EBZ39_10240 [bacterium]|nr:hypothetical protein [bacterium]
MIVSDESVEKLERIVRSRYGDVVGIYGTVEDEWLEFLNKHDITVLTLEDIKESFQYLLNFDSAVKNGLCLLDPHGEEVGMERFLIVPREFAEKLLVLGGFPD